MLGMLVDSNSANPVKGDEVPSQRSADSSNVDETGSSAVAEVCQGQIGEVDHEEQLGKPEVRAHPEVDEAEEEQIVGDVVAAYVASGGDVSAVGGVERPCVDELKDEEGESVCV